MVKNVHEMLLTWMRHTLPQAKWMSIISQYRRTVPRTAPCRDIGWSWNNIPLRIDSHLRLIVVGTFVNARSIHEQTPLHFESTSCENLKCVGATRQTLKVIFIAEWTVCMDLLRWRAASGTATLNSFRVQTLAARQTLVLRSKSDMTRILFCLSRFVRQKCPHNRGVWSADGRRIVVTKMVDTSLACRQSLHKYDYPGIDHLSCLASTSMRNNHNSMTDRAINFPDPDWVWSITRHNIVTKSHYLTRIKPWTIVS